MARGDCEVKAVFGQSVILLMGSEARDTIVAIVVLTEVSPCSLLTGALWPW